MVKPPGSISLHHVIPNKINYVVSLSPKGRVITDYIKKNYNKLISCKQRIQIWTLNVWTIRTCDKKKELDHNFSRCGLDIFAVIYHKIVINDEQIRTKNMIILPPLQQVHGEMKTEHLVEV